MIRTQARLRIALRRLRDDLRGVALMEFAFLLPVFITMCVTGAELTHYITTKMRVSQIALQLSDDAARIGTGTRLSAKKITEADINDLFVGADLQSGELDLRENGRVILTSVEPVANPNTTNRYMVRWQRCYGVKTSYVPRYPRADQTPSNMTGMGPIGREATVQDDNATMFVEVYYVYKPLVQVGRLAPTSTFTEIASMSVRERRDLTDDSAGANTHPNGVYKVAGVTASTC